ncbi:MAG: S41 family peptidase [Ignavibacteriae bacterium HGW-Ignavibacteriae-2]|jgi:carboxyl-terminal processing protease|nr:MAG: S41 family peptidase [Ignavibacteriae bacterium HGW-Ignavibacteriae-2]
MKTNIKVVTVFILFFGLSGFIRSDNDIFFEISRSIDIFGKVYKEVTLNYVDDINPSDFMLSGIKGMLSSLDPYTNYIDESLKKDIDLMTKGKYGGIGASVGIRNDKVTIIDLIEGYSAQRQGLRIGDVIKEINGTYISKQNYEDLSDYLKGDPGKVVKIIIERDGIDEDLVFDLVLEEVQVKNLTYYGFIPQNSNNIYLKLSSFSRSAGDEIKRAILELNKEKEIHSIILDLRGNPGGLLDQAIDVAEKFLNRDQLIVSVMGKDTTRVTRYYAKEEPVGGNSKLVVLVNGHSASASEIVAGAIQDHDRGVIVGEQSFGKGLVQTLIPLSYNTSLKITTARYYTPSGRCIQKIDYSDESKIIKHFSSDSTKEFITDNRRKVFAAGGIEPDTVMSNDSDSKQVERLLARGMFFRFATYFYNTHQNMSMDDFDDDEYFNGFIKYLSNQQFEYSSKAEKLIQDLKSLTENESYLEELKDDINELMKKSESLKVVELKKYKSDVVANIREEIASRISGKDGRIAESLKNDKQYKLALSVLGQDKIYSTLLALETTK